MRNRVQGFRDPNTGALVTPDDAFNIYWEMGEDRSIDRVDRYYRDLGCEFGQHVIRNWHQRDGWSARLLIRQEQRGEPETPDALMLGKAKVRLALSNLRNPSDPVLALDTMAYAATALTLAAQEKFEEIAAKVTKIEDLAAVTDIVATLMQVSTDCRVKLKNAGLIGEMKTLPTVDDEGVMHGDVLPPQPATGTSATQAAPQLDALMADIKGGLPRTH